MTGLGLVLSVLFVPEIKQETKTDGEKKPKRTVKEVVCMFDPMRIIRQYVYPNVFLCVSSLPSMYTTYGIHTTINMGIRYVYGIWYAK